MHGKILQNFAKKISNHLQFDVFACATISS